ncbi:hypothetical protein [Sphingomicrobium aestuariivivum]|uniref:hypothetical protein n=1 Tax=Sphingomicrobium aestuariivivum TaxID=1582356 RepID=UPI001FD68453|nr:hypothetical protein [Sphingomicrobium aestuariivivum]MCJ8191505.1 hypothetical protein [Sphingomicrobium aestuariivivum]
MFHWIMKAITILFGLTYFIALGLYGLVRADRFDQNLAEFSLKVLEPMGLPWSAWFTEQLDVFGAPFITFLILILVTRLTKKRKRG